MALTLRKATLNDLPMLQHWDRQSHVGESLGDGRWEWELELVEDLVWRQQFIAELEGVPIGFLQIIDPNKETSGYWQNEITSCARAIDIWIGEKEYLGKGYGSAMMNLAINNCFTDLEVEAIYVDPLPENIKAHRFYQRLGFEKIGLRTLDGNSCLVMRLSRSARNL